MKETIHQAPGYRLSDLFNYFLKLGTVGFGGPVALVGYMHRDLVERRKWISEDEYKEGLALAQLAPGPLAAQLGIYLGFVHYRVWGATLAGLAFVLPSFVMVVALGMVYKYYEGLSWMQSVFYGVSASVIGIIALSAYKLTIKTVGKFTRESLKTNWLLWVIYIIAGAVTYITRHEYVLLFMGMALLYMVVKAPPVFLKKHLGAVAIPAVLLTVGFWTYKPDTLVDILLFFSKAGAFVFGSGLAIVPFLHGGVVVQYGWLTEQQFLDAVAVAMMSPGPIVVTVAFIGYLAAGFPGACLAAFANYFPCYLFTVIPAPYFKKISKNESIKAFVQGITAAVIGALVGAVAVIASGSLIDIPTVLIATVSIVLLIKYKWVNEPGLLLAAAAAGLLINYFLS